VLCGARRSYGSLEAGGVGRRLDELLVSSIVDSILWLRMGALVLRAASSRLAVTLAEREVSSEVLRHGRQAGRSQVAWPLTLGGEAGK